MNENHPYDRKFVTKAINSYETLVGTQLVTELTYLNNASFVFATHKYYDDEPRFVFGNKKALELWELDLDSFIGMPSRLTAEPEVQGAREALLKQVKEQGYINNYTGIRISSTGKRFKITNAIVWNVLDSSGNTIGQAVKFTDYEYL